jgi:hypothetical protein
MGDCFIVEVGKKQIALSGAQKPTLYLIEWYVLLFL